MSDDPNPPSVTAYSASTGPLPDTIQMSPSANPSDTTKSVETSGNIDNRSENKSLSNG